MKNYIWLLIPLFCVISIAGAEQIFPVCAFHVKDSTWFAGAGHGLTPYVGQVVS